jgi:hypothetical protein
LFPTIGSQEEVEEEVAVVAVVVVVVVNRRVLQCDKRTLFIFLQLSIPFAGVYLQPRI